MWYIKFLNIGYKSKDTLKMNFQNLYCFNQYEHTHLNIFQEAPNALLATLLLSPRARNVAQTFSDLQIVPILATLPTCSLRILNSVAREML